MNDREILAKRTSRDPQVARQVARSEQKGLAEAQATSTKEQRSDVVGHSRAPGLSPLRPYSTPLGTVSILGDNGF